MTIVLVIFVISVITFVVAIATGSGGTNISASVRNVAALDGNEIRVYMAFTNKGSSSGSVTCQIQTTVYNQFGDQVNVHFNSTQTNGNVAAGQTQLLYQDLGVDNGDAQYVTPSDVQITNCS